MNVGRREQLANYTLSIFLSPSSFITINGFYDKNNCSEGT